MLDLGLCGATVLLFHIISVVYLWLADAESNMTATIPIIVAAVAALAGFLTWLGQRRIELQQTERLRKEKLYEALLEAITELSSFGNGAPLLVESQKAWLYASDEVLRAVNGYFKVFLGERAAPGEPTTPEEREARQRRDGAIRLAIRRDLNRNTSLDEDWMSREWTPLASSEKAIREYLERREKRAG